ncbi:MAG: DoxX family protein [Pseudomonadota bacterium]
MPLPGGWAAALLSVMRVAVALAFIQHGTDKLFGFPDFGGSPDALTLPLGILEAGGGGLVLLGLFTRPVAFVLSGQMAVAYWWIHAPGSFFPAANGGEPAMLYCFAFLYLAAAGGGAWSLDELRRKA